MSAGTVAAYKGPTPLDFPAFQGRRSHVKKSRKKPHPVPPKIVLR